ncbi:MAG: hypothetical protein PHO27_12470 [Sulfuricurvum sp.]|nr:hypothetical protein [Sulfuricurvum sp.]
MQQPFMAYENDTDGFTTGNLQIKNGIDTITIEGSLEITKDKEGLEAALKLKRAVDAAIDALKRDRNLPDSIENKTN